jgi:ubiquinone/menaquinone biosynthesis C-methylase UbiE
MDHTKAHWDQNARQYAGSHWASWGDEFAIELEIDTIARYIPPGSRVLDAGCANGFSTIAQYRRHAGSVSITGVDYSELMIRNAREAVDRQGLSDRIDFLVGDVAALAFPSGHFDVVYTTRVLINLPTWERQLAGIDECLRVVRRGGIVVLCEAFWEPLVLLNALRALRQLPALVEHDFNRYLKKGALEAALTERRLEFENVDFSSVYYLGSRFLRELVTNPADYPGYSNPINKHFFELEQQFSGGGFGIQQAYVIRR